MSFRSLPILLFLFFEVACQRKTVGPPPRYAVIRFENLSGDASLDWKCRAASELLPAVLAGAMDGPVLNPVPPGRPAAAPGISTERAAAILSGATRLITGYFDPGHVTAVIEDVASGKTLRTLSANDLDRLAHLISPKARSSPNIMSDAVRFYATGLEASPDAARSDLEQAIRIAPDFGPAWLALTRLDIAKRDRDDAEKTIAEARQRKLDPFTAANLDAEEASLNGNRIAGIAALKKISVLNSGDTQLVRSLAEAEMAAGNFAEAASDWKRLADLIPNDPAVWNSLGYARCDAGDFTGSMAAFEEYRRLAPADANPLDSMGDLNYTFRKFGDAAAKYLAAYAKDQNFQQGGDLYKAAWAKFRAADRAGADELFARFRNVRSKSSDSLVALAAADWLYRTGRTGEAVAQLRQTVNDAPPGPLRLDGYSQLAIWDLLAGDRAKAGADGTLASAVVRFTTQPSATASEWKARAERAFPSPAMSSLERLVLGYALLLDGKREAALPVWRDIAEAAPATDFFTHAIYTRLQGKPFERPLLPDPTSVNQFAGLLDRL